MTAKKRSTPAIWNDPDDAPELTTEFFKSANRGFCAQSSNQRFKPFASITKVAFKLFLAIRAVVICRHGKQAHVGAIAQCCSSA